MLLTTTELQAKDSGSSISTVSIAGAQKEVTDSTVIKKNLFQKIKAYFDDSNVVKEEKAFDVSFIGGPPCVVRGNWVLDSWLPDYIG